MKLQLRTKLLIGYLVVAIIGSGIGAVGIYGISAVNDAGVYMKDRIVLPTAQLVDLMKNMELTRVAVRSFMMARDRNAEDESVTQFAQAEAVLKDLGPKYASTLISDVGKKDYADFSAAITRYSGNFQQIIAFKRSGKADTALAVIDGEGRVNAKAAADALDDMVKTKAQIAGQVSDSNDALTKSMIYIMVGAIVLGFGVSIILAVWLGVFVVSRPLMRISNALGSGSEQIASASTQLSEASQNIANGATEQASSIQETSSSMEELSSMVKQNVTNAKETSILADKAAEASSTGFTQMEKMLESMNEISQSSDKIKKIIKVIDDIAFQTNMLALNAAVEAARAGEAGMGFAVVADEVKNLANRSADAAKETAEMIEDSLKKTNSGLEVATRMTEIFKEILTSVKKVSEMAQEVESASRQQDTGIEQVNKAVIQFDEVVQNNASSAEETASAAEELQSQVESLNEMVSQLTKVVKGRVSSAVKRPASARPEHKRVQVLPEHTLIQSRISRNRELSPEQFIPFEDDEDLKTVK
jgi:methyl-accepting chemotaxis protein